MSENGKSADAEHEQAASASQEAGEQSASEPNASGGEDGTEGAAEASTEELLSQVMAERDRLKEQLLRTSAEFDNYRKRNKRDLEEAERRAREEILRELLPVVDNLERAADAASGAQDASAVAEGVQMVLRQFQEVAGRLQLERLQSIGERFDPNVHDAIQQQESEEYPPGTIIAEVTPGYRLGDRLLRAAVVIVAKAASNESEENAGGSDDSGNE